MEAAAVLQTMASEAEAVELQKLSSHSQIINEKLTQIHDGLKNIQDSDKSETEALHTAQMTLNEMQMAIKNEFVSWGAGLTSTYSTLCDDLQQTNQKGMVAVEKALGEIQSMLETILKEVQQYIKEELGSLEQSHRLVNDNTQAEIKHLRRQNDTLTQMLMNEKMKADKAKEVLMHRMSEMLDVFMNEHHSRLEESLNGFQDQNLKAQDSLESYLQQQGNLVDQMVRNGNSVNAMSQKHSGSAKRTREGTFKVRRVRHSLRILFKSFRIDVESNQVDNEGEDASITRPAIKLYHFSYDLDNGKNHDIYSVNI